jgi:putative ABC transport system substrate-binding protein
MRRRKFIALLGGAAEFIAGVGLLTTISHAARAQQGTVRRVGVLMGTAESDVEGSARLASLRLGLEQAGWVEGRNVQIDVRWSAGDASRARRCAAELVALAPEVILTGASQATTAVQEASSAVPIVFVNVTDPVGAGYVANLAKPGGNITGFLIFEFEMGPKWLELLREITPATTRVAVLRDPTVPVSVGHLAAIQSAGSSHGVAVSPISVRNPDEIERGIAGFAGQGPGAMIVAASSAALVHSELIVGLAARFRLPTIYFLASFVRTGGLISYGSDPIAPYGRAAGYIDRILKGAKPAELPVQAPTKYDLVVNLKTAKTLGLELPQSVLSRADEVIE